MYEKVKERGMAEKDHAPVEERHTRQASAMVLLWVRRDIISPVRLDRLIAEIAQDLADFEAVNQKAAREGR